MLLSCVQVGRAQIITDTHNHHIDFSYIEVVNFFPTTLTQPSCFQESYFATSTSERQTSVITSSVMSTFTMTTSPSTPQVTMKLTTRNKIIIGSACSCALLLILVMAVGILIYDMKRRQQKLVTQQHTR